MKEKDLVGKVLHDIAIGLEKTEVILEFMDGSTVTYETEGDCCSQTWVEHIESPNDLHKGAEILSIENVENPEPWDHHVCRDENGKEGGSWDNVCKHEVLAFYAKKINTSRGTITIEYRNNSNGYYGGSMYIKGNRWED